MAKTLRKFWNLYWSFFRVSLMADLEYRLNLINKIGTDLLWYAAQLSIFEVLFRHTKTISGWDLPSARVFMGVLFLMDAVWMVLFQENLEQLSRKVRRGELDLLLVKPVPSQFMISLQRQNTSYLINCVATTSYLFWTLSCLAHPPPVWKVVALLLVAIPSSQMISYSFRLGFAMLAFLFANADGVNYIWYQLYRLGMRPDTFYPKWLRYTVLSILPVGFLASVPARLMIENFSWPLALATPALGLFFLWVSTILWHKALARYSSASS